MDPVGEPFLPGLAGLVSLCRGRLSPGTEGFEEVLTRPKIVIDFLLRILAPIQREAATDAGRPRSRQHFELSASGGA